MTCYLLSVSLRRHDPHPEQLYPLSLLPDGSGSYCQSWVHLVVIFFISLVICSLYFSSLALIFIRASLACWGVSGVSPVMAVFLVLVVFLLFLGPFLG